jgi:PAS domain S-box-containing protein
MRQYDEIELYKALVEDMPALICRFHPDGTLNYVNKAYREFFSPHGEPLVGRNFFSFIPESEHRQVKSRYLSLTSRMPFVTYEHQVISPAGTLEWQEWTDRAIFDEDGGIIEYQSIGRNITHQKTAESERRRSEEQYRQFFERNISASYITRSDGRILACNDAFVSLFGFGSIEQAMNTNVGEIYADVQDRDEFLSILQREGHLTNYESRFRRLDGKIVDVTENVSGAFDESGRLTRIMGFMVDVTERKHFEQQFHQAQKMEAIGCLAGGIAHDFNNLLMCVQGNASVMLHSPNVSTASREMLQSILRSAANGARLTKQLLGFAHRGSYEFVPLDLNSVVRKTGEMFAKTNRLMVIDCKLEENLPPVEADEGQIEQVLLNLYVNSAHAMAEGGNLHLKTRSAVLAEDDAQRLGLRPGRYAEVTVSDEGAGIEDDLLPKVFDPFFTTKEPGKGTGLGLASAYGIVKNHGGAIEVSSRKGAGTTVTIYLPVTDKPLGLAAAGQEEPRGPASVRARSADKRKPTALVIDDSPGALETISRMLKLEGFRVLVATSGKTAIELYQSARDPIDVIILDMIMPEMGGYEAFNKIREMNPEARIILASGYSISADVVQLLSTGGVEFLQKPFSAEEMVRKIDAAMGRVP